MSDVPDELVLRDIVLLDEPELPASTLSNMATFSESDGLLIWKTKNKDLPSRMFPGSIFEAILFGGPRQSSAALGRNFLFLMNGGK